MSISTNAAAEPVIAQAIEKRVCIQGIYNKTLVILAPHSFFTQNDAAFHEEINLGDACDNCSR